MQRKTDILEDIDKTLQQLITNAEAMEASALSSWEKESFEKVQESLLSHLLFLDNRLQHKHPPYKKRNGLQEKVLYFKRLASPKKNHIRIAKARLEKRTLKKRLHS